MTGMVLCGGQSLRMGSDKGLLITEETHWAMAAVDKLSALKIPVKLSINFSQIDAYATAFPELERVTDNNALELKGPLLGLMSAHIACPSEDLFILACDMPRMETFLLKELYQLADAATADAYLFTNSGEPEPLCAIYTSTALTKIMAMIQQKQLKKFAMKFVLDHLNVATLALKDNQQPYFQNVNAHADLNGL
ncbi:molybdenum cofactor guanylyltransferase [Niabella insulamsoli]|uniref:molybdenum cofactor guanylyltransferase n=1 Tax=Niabella insulamsoli TaxID=3144874 RepID=UPI0031FCD44F